MEVEDGLPLVKEGELVVPLILRLKVAGGVRGPALRQRRVREEDNFMAERIMKKVL